MRKYFRSKSRIIGAVGQPLLFLLALGYGLGSVFQRAGQGNYIEFLVPGIITQTILFASIFWGINIIFDRLWGFLKEMMVAPVSRLRIFIGSVLGGATTSLLQGILVLVVSLFLGFHPYNWAMVPLALAIMVAFAVAITSLGAAMGSLMDNIPGFQSVNQFIIFPLYFLSSSIFPIDSAPDVLKFIASINPISYVVDALRFTLINQTHFGIGPDLVVITAMLLATVAFGTFCFRRIEA
jgi:ABC-2 type transport system permease protein